MTATITQPINEIASTWQLDAAHANVEFAVRHLMISTVKGRFGDIAGAITLDPENPTSASVDVTLQTASIDTRQEQRDAHLRSGDFFDAEKWPTIKFHGNRVVGDTDSEFQLFGDLTIRDVTRPVILDVTKEGVKFAAKGELGSGAVTLLRRAQDATLNPISFRRDCPASALIGQNGRIE